jgi:predicted DNA-binding protein YlxM (UPF0122 family)
MPRVNSVLTEKQVMEARKLWRSERHMSYERIARKFGVSKVAIYNAITGFTFKYLPDRVTKIERDRKYKRLHRVKPGANALHKRKDV